MHVVLGAGADEVPDLPGAVPVRHDRWPDGLGSSLRGAWPRCRPTYRPRRGPRRPAAAQPGRGPPGAHGVRRRRVVAVATYAGRPGHPVLLARETWPLLDGYAVGDRGARDLLRDRPDLVVEVPCDDVGSPLDVDTPADLLRLRAVSDG